MNRNIISDLTHIFKCCVSAVLPENLIRKSVNFNSKSKYLTIINNVYDLNDKNVYVVGTGKAVQNMANEIDKMLYPNIKQGIISIPKGSHRLSNSQNSYMCYYEGAQNNLPDIDACNTTKQIKNLVSNLTENDFLLVLISGGGSALLSLPKSPITLDEKCSLIKKLANNGADIRELNIIRRKVSDIKGGQLAAYAYPAKVVSLILSDVIGPLDIVASGPTFKNCDASSDALDIINKYNLHNELPDSIKNVIESNNSKSTFKTNVDNYLIGSNKDSIEVAMLEASKKNYLPINISDSIVGNVKNVANMYSKLVRTIINYKNGILEDNMFDKELKSLNIPGFNPIDADIRKNIKSNNLCLILGGEITVEVKGNGKGGRNQQLALEFSKAISDMEEVNYEIYFLSAGTDGIDGPTDAAGAFGYKNLIKDSKSAKIDVDQYLENNDSYNFYQKFMNGDLHIITGHTNTNVMDIHLIVIKQ